MKVSKAMSATGFRKDWNLPDSLNGVPRRVYNLGMAERPFLGRVRKKRVCVKLGSWGESRIDVARNELCEEGFSKSTQ